MTRSHAELREWAPALVVFVLVHRCVGRRIAFFPCSVPAAGRRATSSRRSGPTGTRCGPRAGTRSRRRSAASRSARAGIVAATSSAASSRLGTALMPIRDRGECRPDHRVRTDLDAWFNPLSPTRRWRSRRCSASSGMVNTLRGLHECEARADRADALLRRQRARDLAARARPTALPFLFTALKVASVLAMIGAIVGEYFGGALNALGVIIRLGRADLPLRDGVGGDPRRLAARDRALRRGRARRAASSAGRRRRRRRETLRSVHRQNRRHNAGGQRMEGYCMKKWVVGAASCSQRRRCNRRARQRAARRGRRS